jgi:membrane-bound metal-dependent hydrolase YbcI (DUF457 family)
MTPTFILGVLLAALILIRQVRWLAMIALLVAIGYFAHGYLDYWPHDERRDRTVILRPQ